MLYLVAFFCPPIALVLCGKPLSAVLNLLWIIEGFVSIAVLSVLGVVFVPVFALGATAHAILVVNQHLADERQRELIGALGGTVKPKSNWEINVVVMLFIIVGVVVLILLTTGILPWRFDLATRSFVRSEKKESRLAEVPAFKTEAVRIVPVLPSIDGWSISEVESTYGTATHKDKTTGWAVWPKFKAHFQNGVVNRVEALELK